MCGNQRHQSHSCGASTITTSARSAGPTHVATCTSSGAGDRRGAGSADGHRRAGADVGADRRVVEVPGRGDHRRRASAPPASPPASATVQSTGPQPRLTRKASSWSPRRHHTSPRIAVAAAAASATPGVVARWWRHRASRWTLDVDGEAGDVAVPAGAPATAVAGGSDRPDRPQPDRRHAARRRRTAGTSATCATMAMTAVTTVEHSPATMPVHAGPAARRRGSGRPHRLGLPRRHERAASAAASAAMDRRASAPAPPRPGRRVARHGATDPQAAGAEHDDAAVGHRCAAADGLAVDTARHAAGQLQQLHRPVGGHVEQRRGAARAWRRRARRRPPPSGRRRGGRRRATSPRPAAGPPSPTTITTASGASAPTAGARSTEPTVLPRRTPARDSGSWRDTAWPSTRMGSRGSRPRASPRAPSGSSHDAGVTVTRRPDGSSISKAGDGGSGHAPWVSRRAERGTTRRPNGPLDQGL